MAEFEKHEVEKKGMSEARHERVEKESGIGCQTESIGTGSSSGYFNQPSLCSSSIPSSYVPYTPQPPQHVFHTPPPPPILHTPPSPPQYGVNPAYCWPCNLWGNVIY